MITKFFSALKSKLLLIITVVLSVLAVYLNWMFVIPAAISFFIGIEAGETDFIKNRLFPSEDANA
jgi:hypothetical protein